MLFVAAGVLKLFSFEQFVADVNHFQILPAAASVVGALYIPWLEICAGLAVFTGWQRSTGRLIMMLLLVVFTAVLFSGWLRNLEPTCGCFGDHFSFGLESNYLWLFLRNISLFVMLLAAACISLDARRRRAL